MRTVMRRCTACGRYTLRDACPVCGEATASPVPPRYSPQDRYGKYRRALKREVGGPWKTS